MASNTCAVSVVYDMFGKQPDAWFNKDRISLFNRMIGDAQTFDVEANQPNCQDPEKAKLLERIAELEKQLDEKENG